MNRRNLGNLFERYGHQVAYGSTAITRRDLWTILWVGLAVGFALGLGVSWWAFC